ncbi:uncharacterized protein LOC109513973 isoform X2 [Hippocampus comes]|uniref:uncharacterized protein LOC109513973 isoform X2 n=1 Tax=Hippocampus comes TaxID=109280 RepID=UPI00094E3134|nr:PREDICTED: uncharacterized protein LOC109513973 isoform X2 [Hippocampus comes]
MSTDDFQTKYACFMDSLVKSTVAETTRLFETVVDELKAELSKVKTENEALKTTCRQIADAKTFAIRESSRGGRPQIQDNAVQCDLLPCHLLLIEQQVGPSVTEQGKQCTEQEMVYILLNDNDVDAEKGAKNLTVSLPNHEHSEPTVVSGNIVCAIADPPPSSACRNETLGPETQLPSLSETPAHEQAKGQDIAPTLPNKQLGAEKTKCGLTEDKNKCEPGRVNEEIQERKQHSESQNGASHGDIKNSQASPTAPIPQAPSHPLGIPRRSSVMVQDAMLLIEAMAQSKNLTSAQENPIAQDWCSRPVVTSPSVIKSQVFSSQSPPTAEVSDKGAEEVSTNQTLSVTYTTASSSCQSHIRVPTEHQKEHGVGSSGMTLTFSSTAAASGSLEQRAPPTQTLLAEPLQTMVVSEPVPQKVFSKSPCTRPQRTIAPPSTNQITAVMSTVAPAQKKFTPTASSSSELSQRKNDVTCAAAAPLDMSDTEIKSPEQGADPEPCKNIKIAIRRATDATSQPQLSEIPVASRNKNSVGPGVTVSPSSHRPNAGAQMASGENKTPLASGQTPLIASPLSSPQVECSSQQASVCESFKITPGEQAAASSSELLPAKSSPLIPVIRLKRLPNLASSTGSFLVSQLFCHAKESGVVPPDSASSLINEQAPTSTVRSSEVAALSTGLHPNLKETSVGEIRKTSEKATPCSAPDEAPPTGLSACTPSCGSESVLEKATMDFDKVEFPAVTDQARKTGTVDEERLNTVEHNFVSPNGSSTTPAHSSPITKDPSVPHLQSTETEFFSQLELLPVNQDAEKITTIESADAQSSCDERTSTDGRRKSHKKSIVACPGVPLKTYSRTKRTKTNSEPHTSQPCFPESPKKPRLENVSTTEQDSTQKPVPTNTAIPLSPTEPLKETEFSQLSLRNQRQTNISCTESETVSVRRRKPVVTLYRLSLKDTTDSTSIIAPLPRAGKNVSRVSQTKRKSVSGSLKIGGSIERVPIDTEKPFRAEDGASKPVEATVCPRSSSIAGTAEKAKSAPVGRFLSSRSTSNAASKKSGDFSQSPRSGSTKVELCVTQTTVAAVTTGKPSTNEGKDSPKKLKATNVCLWSNTTEGTTAAVKTKLPYQSPKKIACVKKTHFNCPRDQSAHETTTPPPPRKKFTRDDKKPKKSQLPPVSQNESRIIKNVPRPQTSNCESLWICNLSELENSKRASNSLMGKSVSPSALSPKSTEIAPGSSKTGESTAKKSRMNQMPTVQDNAKEQNAKKLAQEAKANPIAKMKQTKSNIPKQGIHHHASNQTGNKCTSQTVRSPPKMQAGEATQAKAATKPRSAGARHLRKNQCGECGRILSSKTALESHVSVHTGHRPFSCTLCDKSFPDSRGLKRHSIVHRNGRLHVCQQCGKGFVYGFGLAKHVQMVHGKIKPFVCQVCNKSFFTKRDVETHIRVHTGERPFPCHLCEKKFTRSVELNAHLRWHRGEKRHWCPYCGKGFFDQNNLKRHKYIHTGEKPHSCPHCPKHFTQSGHLKKHVKNVHKVL